ncbi:MAG: long-chain fatty acid--CoA ligase [Capsulimonas sp.]|uniref:AMP-dependent synthetase/ligase n=1 Tax=Capsulimonas sp. TaxID=2494211 RepID=UPI0032675760
MPSTIKTVTAHFAESARKYPDRPALTAKSPETKDWVTLTYKEVEERARRFSLGLRALGVERGDRVAILSENRTEWAIADIAILSSGAVTVPIYSTLPPAQVAHILADSGAKAMIVSDAKQLQKANVSREQCPGLTVFVTMEESSAKGDVLSFDAVMLEGDRATLEESFEARRDSVKLDDLMSLVYTSGTTGNPKGAMLTHANMGTAIEGAINAFPVTPPNDTFLSFLPLCHVFERVTYSLSLAMGSHTYYNDSIFKLIDNMAFAKPTVMQCVPRVFESIHERVTDTIAKEPENKQKAFAWAIEVGGAVAERRNAGQSVSPMLLIKHAIAEKLVLSKLRDKFGGKLKFFVSGGAPLNAKTAGFFNAIGIPILEGWGLTETTAACATNPYGRAKIGTVGIAGFGATIKVAGDGELLTRGPNVMRGYWNNPEATKDVIDADGWFHTGDIGVIDSEGYVKITDRKKDIIVLANGKNVAPQPIESLMKQSPFISEIVLLGDKSGGVSALVLPSFDKLKTWAQEQGKEKMSPSEMAADPAVRKLIKTEIDKLSGNLADYEKIKRIALLEKALSIENGELTPTMKIKRKVVSENYGRLLERES